MRVVSLAKCSGVGGVVRGGGVFHAGYPDSTDSGILEIGVGRQVLLTL